MSGTGSLFINLRCSRCGREYQNDRPQKVCTSCGGTLFSQYDLEKAKSSLSKDSIAKRPRTMWRYRELLPVFDSTNLVSLSEGYTPILELRSLGEDLGFGSLLMKDDGVMPTGSFKARGQSSAISKAKELGVQKVALASAGNAGIACAAYSARAGIHCDVFIPKDAPDSAKKLCVLYGADTHLVDGLINDCAKIVTEGRAENGWFELSTLKEPYRVEGKKTMGLEIAEQLGWELPDVIVYPAGGGTGLVGMWKAFQELETLGWLSEEGKKPRMVAVQSSGCSPIVDAFDNGDQEVERPFQNARTIASGLRVPFPYASEQILKVIRDSGSMALSVPDDEIRLELANLARKEGVFACPEGAATLAAMKKLIERKMVDKSERILLYNTGSGLNYLDLVNGKV